MSTKKKSSINWLLGGFSTQPQKNAVKRHTPSSQTGHTVFRDVKVGKEANKEMVERHNAVRKNIKDERTRREKVHKTRVKVINKRKRGLSKVLKKNWKIIW